MAITKAAYTPTDGIKNAGSFPSPATRLQLQTLLDQIRDDVNVIVDELEAGALNTIYYTETETDGLVSGLQSQITTNDGKLTTHKSSADHDGRYYTEAELGAVTDGSSGADKIGSTAIPALGSEATVQSQLEKIVSLGSGAIPAADSLTESQMSAEMKKQAGGVAPYNLIIPNTTINAAGDILVGTANDTPSVLPIGTASQQLRVNSGATAPEWFTPSTATQDVGYYADFTRMYAVNVKTISLGQSSETWTSGAGTQSADVTNVKIGGQSIKILENDNTAGFLYSTLSGVSLDLTKFGDGTLSDTSQYIRFSFYISDVTKVDTGASKGILLTIGTSGGAYYSTSIISGLITGWNYVDILKSTFSASGAADWANILIAYVGWNSLDNAQNAYVSFQSIQLVRKDPSSAIPNPFQHKENNAYVRDFAINVGTWFLGSEFGQVHTRNLSPTANGTGSTASALVGVKSYTISETVPIIINQKFRVATAAYTSKMSFEKDASNRIFAGVNNNNLTLNESVAGTDGTASTLAMTLVVGDTVDMTLTITGTTAVVKACKNGDCANPYEVTKEITITGVGYLALGSFTTTTSSILNAGITTISHADHATSADSLTGSVGSWIPTLTWGTATPTITSSYFRYRKIGGLTFFTISIICSDGKAASSLVIPLPSTPKGNGMTVAFNAIEKVNTTYSNPYAINVDSTANLTFLGFSAMTNAQASSMFIEGFYEG